MKENTDYFLTGAAPDEVWPLIRTYHYSRRMPANIQHCYAIRKNGGLFGDYGEVLAASIFSIPPARWSENVIELTRLVRVPSLSIQLSKLISFSCSMLKKQNHHLLVSFADRQQQHHGGIYQACGWFYNGCRDKRADGVIINGVFNPARSCNNRYGTRSVEKLRKLLPSATIEDHFDEGKHLYWKYLSVIGKSRAKRIGLKNLPYPKPDHAVSPLDEHLPGCVSDVQPVVTAPLYK